MSICQKCQAVIPRWAIHNGKQISLARRKYCTTCSPIGERRIWRGKEIAKIRLGITTKRLRESVEHSCKTCGRLFTMKTNNTECSTCRNGKNRQATKKKAIDFLGGKCKVCGYQKCERALVFHHLQPDNKSMGLSGNWQQKWNILEKELEKCILLCNRCHEELHEGLITI